MTAAELLQSYAERRERLWPSKVIIARRPGSEKPEPRLKQEICGRVPYDLTTPAQRLITNVAQHYGLTYDDLMGRNRAFKVSIVRSKAMWAVHRRFPEMSSTHLAIIFKRDHTTILYVLGRLKARQPSAKAMASFLRTYEGRIDV